MLAAFAVMLWSPVAQAWDSVDAQAFSALRAADARVATVGYRLASGNRALCTDATAPLSGLVLHALGQYRAADRPMIGQLFGMTLWPGVMAVVPGSPADRAGIREDDQIVAVGAADLADKRSGAEASRDAVERANRLLSAALQLGRATLTVERGGKRLELVVEQEAGCASDIELLSDDAVNAWADGQHVMVGGGLLDRCDDDDSLALVVAHELAHNLLDRRPLPPKGRSAEAAADAIAVRMVVAAGYDARRAIAGLERLIRGSGPSLSHPAPRRRIAALQAVAASARP